MLSAHHITKTYGIHTVLQDITFSISAGERLGLIGPNGCGKTTLLRILTGQEQPDSGMVARTRPDLRIGYLSQGFDLDPALTIAEACSPASASRPGGRAGRTGLCTWPPTPPIRISRLAYDEALANFRTCRPSTRQHV